MVAFKGVGYDYIMIRSTIGSQIAPDVMQGSRGPAKIFYFRPELRNLG